MAKATLESIRTLSDKLHNRWTREFAGKPRHTRNLGELEKLLEKAAGLTHKAKGIPGEKGDALEKVVVERWKLYRGERDAIAESQYDRPVVGEIHDLGQRIERALAVWRRHYAGRDRRTRDLPRLDEVIQILSVAVPRLESLQEHPEVRRESLEGLRGQVEVLRDERGEIEKLRRGSDASQRNVSILAEAQSALDQYRVHFARQPRATCTPARLERIINMMTNALAELRALPVPAEAEAAEALTKNQALLDSHLAAWKTELPLLIAAKEGIQPRDLTNQLGAVANQLFQTYQREFAGKERSTRNLQLLSDLCDRLTEVGELMTQHDTATREAINRKNVPIIDDRLRRYEAEWVEIGKAKAALTQAAGSPTAIAGPIAQAAQAAAKAPVKPKVTLPGITIADKKPS